MGFVVEGLKCVKMTIRIKFLHKEYGHKLFVGFMMWKIALDVKYEGWNFNSGNYLFTTDTK